MEEEKNALFIALLGEETFLDLLMEEWDVGRLRIRDEPGVRKAQGGSSGKMLRSRRP